MGVYEAWNAAAEAVFGKEAAAAAAAAHARPKSLTPGEPGATLSVTRIEGPAAAAFKAVKSAKAALPPAPPGGIWYELTWTVNSTQVLPSDRLIAAWEPPTGSPADAAVTGRDPLQFAFVSVLEPATYTTGNGTALVWLPPMRQTILFAYVRQGQFNLWADATVITRSEPIEPPKPNKPAAVKVTGGVGGGGKADRASLDAAPNAVAVTWQTRDIMAGGLVRWGPAGGPLDRTALATSGDGSGAGGAGTTFKAATGYCPGLSKPATAEGAPWDFASLGVINRAALTGLAPGSSYEFEVVAGEAIGGGGGGGDGSAETVRGAFTTPPAAKDFGAKTRLILLADGGTTLPDGWDQSDGNLQALYKTLLPAVLTTPGSAAYAVFQGALALFGAQSIQPAAGTVADAVTARLGAGKDAGKPHHGIVFTGDISYARGEAIQWDVWSALWGPALRTAPLLAAAGNHESCGPPIEDPLIESTPPPIDDGGECGQGYARLLGAPEPSGPGRWWYASRAGPLTILHLNSDQSLAAGSAQGDWLAAALHAVDRTVTPWLAVAIHRPMYSDDPTADQQGPAATLQANIERLLVAHSVDLVLSGHLHTYQRSCPVAKGNCFAAAASCSARALDPVEALKCKVREAWEAKVDEVKDDGLKLWHHGREAAGKAGASAGGLPQPPPGVVPPTHVLLGSAGFRSPLQAWADRPAWLAVEGRAYGLGDLEVSRTRLALTATTPDGRTTMDSLVLTKPAWWKPPSLAEAGAWFDALPVAPVPETINPATFETLAILLGAVSMQELGLLRCVGFFVCFVFFWLSSFFSPTAAAPVVPSRTTAPLHRSGLTNSRTRSQPKHTNSQGLPPGHARVRASAPACVRPGRRGLAAGGCVDGRLPGHQVLERGRHGPAARAKLPVQPAEGPTGARPAVLRQRHADRRCRANGPAGVMT